jgi:hypothetical protein
MSSRAWTEIATGPEARGFWRWGRRKVLPIFARSIALFALAVAGVLAFPEIVEVVIQPTEECFLPADGNHDPCESNPVIRISDFF